ncbi:TlpA disulfide reductase family protein [uncultured Alistipes sp.]|uniref:TlpA disulfide reductase family protein n=1 Tax=uncultured Alistipes sp. TaxID=538949 RepID=UPI002605B215|nr:TlpA disulfide reductase family protein [uncultured Alistipes sp.]
MKTLLNRNINRYRSLLPLATALLAAACSPQRGYELLGEVPEVWEGKSVVLYAVDAGRAEAIDSTTVAGGRFRLQGELPAPRRCRGVVYLDPNDRTARGTQVAFEVLLDSTQVVARCDTRQGEPQFTLSGGASQEALAAFRNETAPLSERYGQLFDRYIEAFYHRSAREEGIALARELSQLDAQLLGRKTGYIVSHPASGVSLDLLGEVLRSTGAPARDSLAALFGSLSPALRESAPGRFLEEQIRKKRMLRGESLPEIQVCDTQGKSRSLRELLRPGAVTLVEVWASWCAPCRDDIPYLREAYARYHARGFDIVGISVDTQRDAWLQALATEKMPWRQFNDAPRACFEAFETGSVPTSLLVDGQGRILKLDARGGWLGAELETIYDE